MLKKTLVGGFILFLVLFALIGCSAKTTDSSESDDTKKSEEKKEEKAGEKEKSSSESGEQTVGGGGVLKIAYAAQPHMLDTHLTTNVATSDIMRHVYETLLTVDSEYNVKPMLAESWEQSEDGKLFTFYIRQGVTFHNGEELKADDVAASLNRWKGLPSGRGLFTNATFEAVDDYTLELQLPETLSIALTGLAHMGGGFAAIMPKEVVESANEDEIKEYIGTGPFKFDEWKQDQHILLTPYENYQSRTEEPDGLFGKREALLDELYFMFVTDPSTRVAGIQSGEYDLAHAVPFDNADQLESIEGINNHVYPIANLVAHFNKKQGLFKDVNARRAVLAAVKPEDVLKAAYSNDKYYMMNHSLMMPHQQDQWYSDEGKELYNQNDAEKAKQLLEEAGYNGEEITIIATRDYEDQYLGGVVLQEQLQAIGMKVNLEVYDWPTLSDKIYQEDAYDIFMMGNTPASEPTSSVFLWPDYAGWIDDPKLEEMVAKFRSLPTIEEAKPLFDDFQAWFYDYVPSIRFGDFNRVASTRDTVSDFQFQDGFVFWNKTNNK